MASVLLRAISFISSSISFFYSPLASGSFFSRALSLGSSPASTTEVSPFSSFSKHWRGLFFEQVLEFHVVIAYEMIAFDAGALRGGAIAAEALPGQHAFADMYATVVHDAGLYHIEAACFGDLGDTPAQEIIAEMPQVQGLLVLGEGILHHYFLPVGRMITEIIFAGVLIEELQPLGFSNGEVQETFDHVEGS